MATGHKLGRARVRVAFRLPPQEALLFAEEVAAETRGLTWDLDKKVRLTPVSREADTVEFAVGRKRPFMTFVVRAEDNDDGGSVVTSQLAQYSTSQPTVFGFIPTGPKKLVGYGFYRQFMQNLKDAAESRDPAAVCTIEEPS